MSKAPQSLVLLVVTLFKPFSDQESFDQQSPVGDGPLLFFLDVARKEKKLSLSHTGFYLKVTADTLC